MKNLGKREKWMLLIFGMVLIGYLYYSLFYARIEKEIESTKMNIEKYIQEINNAKEYKKLFEQQTIELGKIKAQYEEAKVALPEMEMNPEIVHNIQEFFKGSGVEVTSITIGKPVDLKNQSTNTDLESDNQNSQNSSTNNTNKNQTAQKSAGELLTVPITITLSGDNYSEVMKFVSLFENDKRFTEITNIVITANRPSTLLTQPSSESTTEQKTAEKQTNNNEIQVVVVGEGEGYNEIPVESSSNEQKTQQKTEISQTENSTASSVESKPKIEVSIEARYYYVNTNTSEQPNYNFTYKTYGKKDLFKE